LTVIDVAYPKLLSLFTKHLAPKRSESASFLIWYLENYYRLDEIEAVDAVCDNRGDKGVDGILVNDDDKTIIVFQSQISQSQNSAIGDASLRAFAGTLTQFKDRQSIEGLIQSAGNAQVAVLATRLDLVNKVTTYQVRGEFISNINVDLNGANFLTTSIISFVGKETLMSRYISDQRDVPIGEPASFDITGVNVSEYIVDPATKAVIVTIKATELVRLHGISDQSLFAYNVRGPLGGTKVNKDIVATVRDQAKHKLFPLFHNGITIIAKQIEESQGQIRVQGYFVVNGCQSLTALFNNKDKVTDNLRVLVKFIQADPSSQLAKDITEYSNNQNAVKPRDFMSNNTIQIRLQNEFTTDYDDQYFFDIKRGETTGGVETISNEDAGLLLMAFDLKEPWATHRKYQVFEEKHADLFGRPEVTADRIVLLRVINGVVTSALPNVDNQLIARYALMRFFLVYVVRLILEGDSLPDLLTNPRAFVREPGTRAKFAALMGKVMDEIIIDLNAEIEDLTADFDYRGKLRDQSWIRELKNKLVTEHLKQIKRGKVPSLKEQWEQMLSG